SAILCVLCGEFSYCQTPPSILLASVNCGAGMMHKKQTKCCEAAKAWSMGFQPHELAHQYFRPEGARQSEIM
ncbi:MAG: hypothetical protein AAB110_03415, partial [Candidatus Desantisbacteria bacterium]